MDILAILKRNIGETNLKDIDLQILLDLAKGCFLNIRYPYNDGTYTEVPEQYKHWQIMCAKELYNKLGSEGISSYSENGLSVSFDSAMSVISPSLRSMIIPKAGVPK